MNVLILSDSPHIELFEQISSSLQSLFITADSYVFDSNMNQNEVFDQIIGNNSFQKQDNAIIFVPSEGLVDPPSWLCYLIGLQGSKDKSLYIYSSNTLTWSNSLFNSTALFSDLDQMIISLDGLNKKYLKSLQQKVSSLALEPILETQNHEAFLKAIVDGDISIVSHFITAGFVLDRLSVNLVTPLGLAARLGALDIVTLLCQEGADVNLLSQDRDNSPLMDAASEGHVGVLKFLLSQDVELECKSKSGQTALVLATGNNQIACAQMLIEAGADPDAQDSLGLSARKYASLYSMKDILKILPPEKV